MRKLYDGFQLNVQFYVETCVLWPSARLPSAITRGIAGSTVGIAKVTRKRKVLNSEWKKIDKKFWNKLTLMVLPARQRLT